MKSRKRTKRHHSHSTSSAHSNPLAPRLFAPEPEGDRSSSVPTKTPPAWDLTQIPILPSTQRQGLLQASPDDLVSPSSLAGASTVEDVSFNPFSIVNDLRRAIDTHDTDAIEVKPASGFFGSVEYIPLRKVDAVAVIRELDHLTTAQIERVRTVYSSREEGRTLENDLFEKGATGHASNLKPEQRARIKALLKGTKAETAGGPAPLGRIEADVIELHELLSDELTEGRIERIMTLHRRPVTEIDQLDAQYLKQYGKEISFDQFQGLQRSRLHFLREGNWKIADACAIEAKRRAIEALDQPSLEKFTHPEDFQKKRQVLVETIELILERTRQEAMAGPEKGDQQATQAVQELLATQSGAAGKTLGDTLGKTLGTQHLSGAIVETTARCLWELETSHTINTEKLAALLRGLRTQAERDVTAKAFDPSITPAEKEAIAGNIAGAIETQAKQYTQAFIRQYESIRGEGRTYTDIIAGANAANEDLLNLLTTGGGQISDLDELDIAIRNKDKDKIKAVLQRQRNQAAIQQLANQYEQKREVSLRRVLFGLFEDAELAALPPIVGVGVGSGALMTGRDAVLTEEALQKPAELGGETEVRWIASFGERETQAAEDNSGAMGLLREIGDDPETQVILNETRQKLLALRDEWLHPDPWAGRSRSQILAEMRRLRSTLTGDASAYEADNAQMVGQLRSILSFAVQAALAIALPGVGAGFVASLALNISATVVSKYRHHG
jgi:hypothetical protein